jgi:hypothetical protein
MRDYGNMPLLEWTGQNAAIKAKAQIMHEEPVILQMPETFDATVNAEEFSGKVHEVTGILYDCEGPKVLEWLANRNDEPDLHIIAEACAYSSSLVDIDSNRKRLIVHD